MPRIPSMSLRTNGVGVDLPPRIWRAVGSQRWRWPWSTTGGVYLCGWEIPKHDWKRSRVGRFCSRRSRVRLLMVVQNRSLITSQHAEANKAKVLLEGIHELINKFKSAAEQLKIKTVWQLVCEHILITIARFRSKNLSLLAPPTPALPPVN